MILLTAPELVVLWAVARAQAGGSGVFVYDGWLSWVRVENVFRLGLKLQNEWTPKARMVRQAHYKCYSGRARRKPTE